MTYTFTPKHRFAKASGSNLRISTRKAELICKVIRRKTLKRAKRLLVDMAAEKRGLDGKYYTKTVKGILELMESCEKNAEFLGLDNERLFVHASAHQGTTLKRRRRKSAFGSSMKSTVMEMMLIERGKLVEKVSKSDMKKHRESKQTETDKKIQKEKEDLKKDVENLKARSKEIKEAAEEVTEKAEI